MGIVAETDMEFSFLFLNLFAHNICETFRKRLYSSVLLLQCEFAPPSYCRLKVEKDSMDAGGWWMGVSGLFLLGQQSVPAVAAVVTSRTAVG